MHLIHCITTLTLLLTWQPLPPPEAIVKTSHPEALFHYFERVHYSTTTTACFDFDGWSCCSTTRSCCRGWGLTTSCGRWLSCLWILYYWQSLQNIMCCTVVHMQCMDGIGMWLLHIYWYQLDTCMHHPEWMWLRLDSFVMVCCWKKLQESARICKKLQEAARSWMNVRSPRT